MTTFFKTLSHPVFVIFYHLWLCVSVRDPLCEGKAMACPKWAIGLKMINNCHSKPILILPTHFHTVYSRALSWSIENKCHLLLTLLYFLLNYTSRPRTSSISLYAFIFLLFHLFFHHLAIWDRKATFVLLQTYAFALSLLPFRVCVTSCPCVCGVRLNGCIIRNHSEFGHWCFQAQQSDHLRDYLVNGPKVPVSPCMSLLLSFFFPGILQRPSPAHRKTPAAMAINPYLLPLLPLSFTSMGGKGQGHEDKHKKSESGCEKDTHTLTHIAKMIISFGL